LAVTGRRLSGQVEDAASEQERTLDTLQETLARMGVKPVTISAGVERILSKTVFLVDQRKAVSPTEVRAIGKPMLVIAPYLIGSLTQREYLLMRGEIVKFDAAAIARAAADYKLDVDRQVALEIRSRSSSKDPVFIWGFEPSIYFLADRPLASRWTYDVPQRTPWQRDFSRRELLKDLSLNRPKIIVVEHWDVFPSVTGNKLDSRDELPNFPELKALIDHQYRKVREIDHFEIYEQSEVDHEQNL
jgi:hypothetical protein